MKDFIRSNKTALLFPLLYLVPALAWVLFADSLFFEDPLLKGRSINQDWETAKELSFVLAISIILFFILRIHGQRLKKSKLEYEYLFDKHPYPMWIYDLVSLKILAVNDAGVDHYGYSKKEFLSMTIRDIRPTEDVSQLEGFLSDHTKVGKDHASIWSHRKRNGDTIVVEVNASDVDFKGKPARLVAIMDITDKLKKEEEISKLSLVAENTTNSVIISNKEGQIEWVNNSFTLLTGYTLEEVKGKRPSSFLHGPKTDPTILEQIAHCTSIGEPFKGDVVNYHKDGSYFWISLSISPIKKADGVSNHIIIQTDITAIKQQNEKLREIAFMMSHNFRRPLANILGIINLLELKGDEQAALPYLKQSAEELDKEVIRITKAASLIKQPPTSQENSG